MIPFLGSGVRRARPLTRRLSSIHSDTDTVGIKIEGGVATIALNSKGNVLTMEVRQDTTTTCQQRLITPDRFTTLLHLNLTGPDRP